MTHPDVPVSERERLGITGGLVRVSAGLEDVYDLIADFAQALDASAFCASREQTLAATH